MLRSIIYKVVGPTTLFRIKRVLRKIKSGKPAFTSIYPSEVISKEYHATCGYYDLDPVCNGKLLYGIANKEMSTYKVCVEELCSREMQIVDTTYAVNWQQGCRLKWIGASDFIYNAFDREKQQYYAVEMKNDNRQVHELPIYDATQKYAVSLDFSRLGHMRPGYGYTDLPRTDITGESLAFIVFSMENDSIIDRVTYRRIIDASGLNPVLDNCYINHVSISPDSSKFMFFFVEIQGNRHMCYLMVYQNGKISILEKTLSASHYTWMSNTELLVTAYDDKHLCRYYVYDINRGTRVVLFEDKLIQDGHPTRITQNLIITDTYPDKEGFQYLKIVDLCKEEVKTIASVYSSARHIGEQRCDLHPRFSSESKSIYFDADVDGHRRIYQIKIEDKLHES